MCMNAEKKTNAMRILEKLSIPYESSSYIVDEAHIDARSAAEKLGIDPERVFKTIVMCNEHNTVFVFCVPASAEVNLKKARALTGSGEIIPVKQSELLNLTGYIRGGCSPVGMKKKYKTFIDETAVLFDTIYVSAGMRGQQLVLCAEDLARAADACFAALI